MQPYWCNYSNLISFAKTVAVSMKNSLVIGYLIFPQWTLLLRARHSRRKSSHNKDWFPWHRGIQKLYAI